MSEMREKYIEEIKKLVEECDNLGTLDLIYKLLLKL